MKQFLMIFTLLIGLVSCCSDENTANAKSPTSNRVEVIYFHGKQRCATCKAIEKNTRDVINSRFANELKKGKVIFKIVDISTQDGEKIANKYEVTWSSLFVNKWHGGKETRNDLTDYAFGNARKNPDAFKKTLADKIRQSLK